MIETELGLKTRERLADNFERAVFRVLQTVEDLQGEGPVSVDQLYDRLGDSTATIRLAFMGNSLSQQIAGMVAANFLTGHLQGKDPHTSEPIFTFSLTEKGTQHLEELRPFVGRASAA